MAKRRLKKSRRTSSDALGEPGDRSWFRRWTAPQIGSGILAAMLVYAVYFPSDSIEVERGAALWFCVIGFLAMGVVGFFVRPPIRLPGSEQRLDALDLCVFALAGWVAFAAFGTSSFGNLRLASNEAWLWIAGAATVYASRRLLIHEHSRRGILLLVVATGAGLAMDTFHQQFISLPEARAAYRADPDLVLSQAGIDAPANSALRMVFENRLFDGGPSATFALANSLAAYLVFALAVAVSIFRSCWARLGLAGRSVWGIAIFMLLAAILATRSRSALIASLVAVVVVLLGASARNRDGGRVQLKWIVGSLGVGLFGLALIAMFGDAEWFSAAPASLRFRLEYWHSTWRMVCDHPWFGCGPGNFQSVYDQYRGSAGNEQIADPHNFFFETLGSGGFVAALMLGCSFFAAVRVARSNRAITSASEHGATARERVHVTTLGAATMLGSIWGAGLVLSSLPDFAAHKCAIPLAIGLLFWMHRSLKTVDSKVIDLAFSIGLLALMIHLVTAGGWTVPGIAILIWISTASLTRFPQSERGDRESPSFVFQARSPAGLVATGFLIAITFFSIRPVAAEKLAIALVESTQQKQQPHKVGVLLKEAIQADTLAVRAPLYQSNYLRWRVITLDGSNAAARKQEINQWRAAVSRVESRCGQNPTVYRQLIAQAIHLYQVTGETEFVETAKRWSEQAIEWSPSDQWLFAQHAEIEQAMGNREGARRFAEEATRLSKLGGNEERAMWLQQINVVEPRLPGAHQKAVTLQGYSILLDNVSPLAEAAD